MNVPTWVFGLIPSIGVAVVFWYVMRSVIRADRKEREELAKLDSHDAETD